jgi:multisubunit Na+/H+ antiporter MnhB subunit
MKFTKEQTLGIIRHTLTFVGGIVLSNGLVDQTTIDVIVGSVITLSGAIWSIVAKRKRA